MLSLGLQVFACGLAAISARAEPSRAEFATRFEAAVRSKSAVVAGVDGWFFLPAELRLLSFDRFWGAAAAKSSRATRAEWADPFPAIVDFHQQLKARGIELLVVPVPPKAAIYPDKLFGGAGMGSAASMAAVTEFCGALRAAGVEVLDLAPVLVANSAHERGAVFCATDTHWSGSGCVLAAQAIAQAIRNKVSTPPAARTFTAEWKTVAIRGDLIELLGGGGAGPKDESIAVRAVSDAAGGSAVEPDAASPVLLLGDSHTLVFHDFLAQRAGLLDQLAMELGFPPDVIGTRGSGATPVRVTLYRRSVKEPTYLAKKKVVVWCFSAREFTEAESGWQKIPVAK